MNRIQFWTLVGISSLVTALLIFQIFFIHVTEQAQVRMIQTQQAIQQGQTCATRFQQLATRIAQVTQQTQDQGLKDLLARQQITIAPSTNAPASSPSPSPAPAPSSNSNPNP